MAMSTANSASILTPEQVGDLVIRPLTQESVAFQASTIARTNSNQYRVPVVTADPDTSWTAEGTEITADDVDLAEVLVTPKKVAGLTVLSNELIADADEDAAKLIGQRLVNSLRRKIDAAYFANTTANGPSGLLSVAANVTDRVTGTAGAFGSNLDAFVDLAGSVEASGGRITAWLVHPTNAVALGKLKEASGSNKGLLQPDPMQPTRRLIAGAPLLLSPDAPTDTVWAVSKPYSVVVLRNDADVQVDSSAFFTSDRTAIRCTLRVGFAFPHPLALGRIRLAIS